MWKICTMHCYRTIILVFVLSLSFQLFFFLFFSGWVCLLLPRHKCFYAPPLLLAYLLLMLLLQLQLQLLWASRLRFKLQWH